MFIRKKNDNEFYVEFLNGLSVQVTEAEYTEINQAIADQRAEVDARIKASLAHTAVEELKALNLSPQRLEVIKGKVSVKALEIQSADPADIEEKK